MADRPVTAGDDPTACTPVAWWDDETTVHSVVVPDTDGLGHEYWVLRRGQLLAKCPSLAAVDEWCLQAS
jgi:hypothetical protein